MPVAVSRDYIGVYKLVRVLHPGNMCQVWEAFNTLTNRRVAIKTLQQKYLRDSSAISAMRQEYEIGKSLVHPNVVETIDFVSDHRGTFLVLEFFSGRNLKMFFREGHERIAFLAQRIIQQAAEGLQYMHEQGWVHRDIKPDNYLMTAAGDVKLIDFSIASRIRGGFSLGKLLGLRSKVQGTRSYMSPEQIRGETVDARSDIYSLGCTIFELLAGRVPFTAVNPDDLLTKHLRAPPPLVHSINENVTPEMSNLVIRMLSKKREQRPATLADFIKEFGGIKLFKTRPKPPPDWQGGTPPAK